MKRLLILAVAFAFAGFAQAEDKKLELPDLKSKEWKEVKDGGGLKIWDVKEGKGDAVKASATVKVHYTGWNLDGTVFDTSVTKNKPIAFGLDDVIKGWGNGVPGMKPGGVRRLYIPYKLAYGEKGRPPAIPAKADLVFEIELLEIK
ncbi:hypothetical protein BH11PLA2_BH11PLA2_18320 [soil metagenome]